MSMTEEEVLETLKELIKDGEAIEKDGRYYLTEKGRATND